MPIAFVLIRAEMGFEREVLAEIGKIDGVEAYLVYGVYDIIAKAVADTREKLKEITRGEIRQLNHVQSTLTLPAWKETK